MKYKKILVTGGAGFVGSHLCERLVALKGYEVYSLDNYFTGSERNHVCGVNYIKGSTKEISKLVNFTPDLIFHLGEYSRVEQSFEDIEKVWEFNTKGIFSVLEFVREKRCKIVYAGSSTKFGDNGEGASASPYAWTKSKNTELVRNYGSWFGISFAITYFYNVYGDREIEYGKYATLIALFKEKMKNNEPLTVVSPGIQKRNFTHIDDIVDGLLLVGDKGYGDGFGIGSDESYSVLNVADMFGGKVEMLAERKGNRMSADVITEKIKALGWSAKQNLPDYIEELRANSWRG